MNNPDPSFKHPFTNKRNNNRNFKAIFIAIPILFINQSTNIEITIFCILTISSGDLPCRSKIIKTLFNILP